MNSLRQKDTVILWFKTNFKKVGTEKSSGKFKVCRVLNFRYIKIVSFIIKQLDKQTMIEKGSFCKEKVAVLYDKWHRL